MNLGVTIAALLAALLDRTIGEPPVGIHPVALFGRVVDHLRERSEENRSHGLAIAIALPLVAAGTSYAVVRAGAWIDPVVGALLAGVVLFVCTSLRMLLESAETVVGYSGSDLDAAREALPALVGRETGSLSAGEIRSAAVESVAENVADGLIAPLVAFGIGAVVSLPIAAAAAAWVKAVNTLDSMLGYPGEFGWASARLDDLVMFVPARLSAPLIGFAADDPDAPLRARRYARSPASPNAGWPMGTLAAALNVRLEKPGAYSLNSVSDLPTVERANDGIAIVRRTGVAAYVLLALWGVILWT